MNAGRWALAVVGGIVLAALLIAIMLVAFPLRTAAAGWLVGFFFWCGPTIGSLAWMMIHRLTGGRWGIALGDLFTSAAAMIPVMGALLIPTLLVIPTLYSWPGGELGVLPSVAETYLNVPAFVARSVIAFAGWTALAIALPLVAPRGALLAAIGLIFYAVLTSLVSVDWVLSLEPPFVSTSFGASVAITELIAALSFAAALGRRECEGVEGDLGGLLLAMVLAITYVDFMAVLVIWYGDLPHKVFWFVQRNESPWDVLALIAFVLGSVVPILSLLLSRIRTSRKALQIVGITELAGLAVYDAYLIAPPFGWPALVTAALSIVAIGTLLMGLMLGGQPALLLRAGRIADVR